METVSVVEAGGAVAGLRAVKIDDSSQSIEVLRGDKVVLHKRQNDFLRLRNSAPVLLRPALEMYARAMGYLAADDVRAFKKELKKARKNYRKASERQKRLEEKLAAVGLDAMIAELAAVDPDAAVRALNAILEAE